MWRALPDRGRAWRTKTPGGWIDPSPPGAKIRVVVRKPLEHAEHDGPDKSDCHIRGNNAQSADESHGKPPWFTSLPTVTSKLANRSGWKKSALLLYRGVHRSEPRPMWLKIRENNVLKSP